MTNDVVIAKLRQHATDLQREGGHLFEARALRSALLEIARLERPLADVFASSGRAGLEALPAIGRGIAARIEALLTTGELPPREEPAMPSFPPPADEPDANLLLSIDADFLSGVLPARVVRDGWVLRACFCNTALAHRLGKADDWVVIDFDRHDARRQRTVVTAPDGRRVVRGREAECNAERAASAA